MEAATRPASPIRFADFEFNPRAGEVCHAGTKVRLGEHPLQVLSMLLEQPGEVVTRDELRSKLWPADTFVDFEDGLNHAIGKLREVLGDSAQHPRFVETLPRHGYRFIAPVERPLSPVAPPAATAEEGLTEGSVQPPPPQRGRPVQPSEDQDTVGAVRELLRRRGRVLVVAGLAMVALVAILLRLNVAGLRGRLPGSGDVPRLPTAVKIASVAVLPLENLSHDPEQEHFADGMTDELITRLAKVGSLGVICRTSVMQYKGTKKPLPQIARELNVDAVLEGSVLRSGDQVRITAQLVHAATGRHLWAETYQRGLRDVLLLQSEVAQAVAQEIRLKLSPQRQVRLRAARPVDPEAYEAFLKGRHYWNIQTPEGQLKCIDYYGQAIQKDPNYALAYAQMAHCYDTLSFWEYPPARENRQKASAAARKALELDGRVAEAHLILADQKFYGDWDWSGGEGGFRRAMEMDSSSVDVVMHYGYSLAVLGRHDEAIRSMERARRLDPLSPLANTLLGGALHAAHQDERAVEQYRKTIEFEPNNARVYGSLGSVYESLGRYDEAVAAYLKGASLAGESAERTQALQRAYRAGGIRGYWKKVLQHENANAGRGYASPLTLASIYAHLGEKDQTIAWLERAYQQHSVALIWLKADRNWDLLRSDPRYQDLLRRMKFPE